MFENSFNVVDNHCDFFLSYCCHRHLHYSPATEIKPAEKSHSNTDIFYIMCKICIPIKMINKFLLAC